MTDHYTNYPDDAARFEYANHGTRLPYDRGFYGSTEIPDRREVECDERELR